MGFILKFIFLSTIVVLVSPFRTNNKLLLQNHNLQILKHLNISRFPYESLTSDSLSSETQSQFATKIAIPAHLQEFLNIFEKSGKTFGNLTNLLFEGVESEDCKGHVLEWIIRLLNLSLLISENHKWAIHMVDSWGKIPEGFLTGHVSSYGDFDECVQAKASDIEILNKQFPDTSKNFEGMYCTSYILDYGSALAMAGREPEGEFIPTGNKDTLGDIDVKKAVSVEEFLGRMSGGISLVPLLPSISTCMPNSCSLTDVQNIYVNGLEFTYKALGLNITLLPFPATISCQVAKKPDLDGPAIIVIVLLAILLVLCIGTGVVDYWLNHGVEKPPERGTAYKYLMAFSFYTNMMKCLSTRRSADDLGCLHGIRFLSTAWVVLGHTFSVYVGAIHWNRIDILDVWKDWTHLAIINGTFSVDTFFVMSGMLATYNILKLLDKTKGRLNIPMLYIHRIVRLTPTYAILVGLAATITIYFGNGPKWNTIEQAEKIAGKIGGLIYSTSTTSTSRMKCNGEAWYLANDMQFYLLSPFLIYPIWKWRKIGLPILSLLTVLSCISPALVAHYQDTPYALIMTNLEPNFLNWHKIYVRPWTRIQTFLVGVWLGWILHITRGKRVKLPVWAVVSGWLLSAALALLVIFGIHPWYEPGYEVPKVAGLFYAGLSRFTYAVALAWVIFACVKGYGGVVNNFLSWSPFMPLGRLCFCVYLISMHLQEFFFYGLKVPIRYDMYTMVNLYFAFIVSSYLAGFVATMLFESPFIVLQKLIFEGK